MATAPIYVYAEDIIEAETIAKENILDCQRYFNYDYEVYIASLETLKKEDERYVAWASDINDYRTVLEILTKEGIKEK